MSTLANMPYNKSTQATPKSGAPGFKRYNTAGAIMLNKIKLLPLHYWFLLAMIIKLFNPVALATEPSGKSEMGIEIGILSFLGPDLRIFYQKANSPWTLGFRYLDIEDDFINEAAFGLPGAESDKQYTERVGIYINYQLGNYTDIDTYYLSTALYKATDTIKCDFDSDSDSATGLYFGGGYQKNISDHFGYRVGLLFSPFVSLEQKTPLCSHTSNVSIDIDMSLIYRF